MDLSSLNAYSSYWNLVTALNNKLAIILFRNYLHKNIKKMQPVQLKTNPKKKKRGPKNAFLMIKLKTWYYNELSAFALDYCLFHKYWLLLYTKKCMLFDKIFMSILSRDTTYSKTKVFTTEVKSSILLSVFFIFKCLREVLSCEAHWQNHMKVCLIYT